MFKGMQTGSNQHHRICAGISVNPCSRHNHHLCSFRYSVCGALSAVVSKHSKVFAVHVNIVYAGKQTYKQQRPGGDVSGHAAAYV